MSSRYDDSDRWFAKLLGWLAFGAWMIALIGLLLAPLDNGNLSLAVAGALWGIILTIGALICWSAIDADE